MCQPEFRFNLIACHVILTSSFRDCIFLSRHFCSAPKAKEVLTATARRAKPATSTLSSSGQKVVGRHPVPRAAAATNKNTFNSDSLPASPVRSAATGEEESGRPYFGDSLDFDAAGAGGLAPASSPGLRDLRRQLEADPEPEKILGFVDEV